MFNPPKLYFLTGETGSMCTATGRCDGPFAMTEEEVFKRIGKGRPSDYRVYELVPTERKFATKLEIV